MAGGMMEFKPKTKLARKLWKIRKRIVASGRPLLTMTEIREQIKGAR